MAMNLLGWFFLWNWTTKIVSSESSWDNNQCSKTKYVHKVMIFFLLFTRYLIKSVHFKKTVTWSSASESKLSSFHLEFSFNSICYICLLFYCLGTYAFLWQKFCFKKVNPSDNSLLQVKSSNQNLIFFFIFIVPTNSNIF